MYQIRRAFDGDVSVILKIYAQAREFMARTGNPNQWGKSNPPQEQLIQDIAQGNLHVVADDAGIHGVFAYIPGEDPTYGYIEGAWDNDGPYAAIHRVASDGSGGIFSSILSYCRERCAHLRIDTHADNKVMQHVLEKHGFSRRGIIYLANGDPRIAYEML